MRNSGTLIRRSVTLIEDESDPGPLPDAVSTSPSRYGCSGRFARRRAERTRERSLRAVSEPAGRTPRGWASPAAWWWPRCVPPPATCSSPPASSRRSEQAGQAPSAAGAAPSPAEPESAPGSQSPPPDASLTHPRHRLALAAHLPERAVPARTALLPGDGRRDGVGSEGGEAVRGGRRARGWCRGRGWPAGRSAADPPSATGRLGEQPSGQRVRAEEAVADPVSYVRASRWRPRRSRPATTKEADPTGRVGAEGAQLHHVRQRGQPSRSRASSACSRRQPSRSAPAARRRPRPGRPRRAGSKCRPRAGQDRTSSARRGWPRRRGWSRRPGQAGGGVQPVRPADQHPGPERRVELVPGNRR
jgi:hypothetical protein